MTIFMVLGILTQYGLSLLIISLNMIYLIILISEKQNRKKIVDIVESYIENKRLQHESSLKREEIKKLAYKQLSETYKYCIINTDGDSFIVKNLNNTEVTLSYHQNALNEIVFVVKKIKVNSEHNVKNLIESLGKL